MCIIEWGWLFEWSWKGFHGSQIACSNSKATGFVWLFSTVGFQISVWLNEDDNLNDLEKGFQGSQVARSNSKVTAKGRRRSISYPNLLQIYLFILTCHRYFIQATNMLACILDWNIHTFLFTICQNSIPILTAVFTFCQNIHTFLPNLISSLFLPPPHKNIWA